MPISIISTGNDAGEMSGATDPVTLTKAEMQQLAADAAAAVEAMGQTVPSSCTVALDTPSTGTNIVLTLGTNPRTFTVEECDGLIFNLQQIRNQAYNNGG